MYRKCQQAPNSASEHLAPHKPIVFFVYEYNIIYITKDSTSYCTIVC